MLPMAPAVSVVSNEQCRHSRTVSGLSDTDIAAVGAELPLGVFPVSLDIDVSCTIRMECARLSQCSRNANGLKKVFELSNQIEKN